MDIAKIQIPKFVMIIIVIYFDKISLEFSRIKTEFTTCVLHSNLC